MPDFSLWKECLDYARYAPSPHNTQPWKVKLVSETEADMYYDPARLLPDEDGNGAFMVLALGIFTEMLSIAAHPHGYKTELSYEDVPLDPTKEGPAYFGRLTLVPDSEVEDLDRELIKKRRTSRLPYDGKPVAPEVVAELVQTAQRSGFAFSVSDDPSMIDWVLTINRDTLFYDMNRESTKREVGNWIRYSKREAEKTRDGLWAKALHIASLTLYIAFHARFLINMPGVAQLIGARYKRTTRGTTLVGWFSGSFAKTDDWVRGGRMLARFWLTLTKYGLYMHPFGSVITNKRAHGELVKKFSVDESGDPVWFLVRIGRSKEPPHAYRRELSDIVIP